MFIKGYSNFSLSQAGAVGGDTYGVHASLDRDVSQLFPFINSAVEGAVYYASPAYVRFDLDSIQCSLYRHDVVLAAFTGEDDALRFVDRLIAFLNDLFEKRDAIEPDYKQHKPLSVLDIYKLLPKTNCRKCGFLTCMAFAGALRMEQTTPDKCPEFAHPITEKAVYPVYDENGNLASTIEINIDTTKLRSDQEKYEKHIAVLKKELAEIVEEKQSVSEKENIETDTSLTHREIEVLRWVADGATNTEISEILNISPHTVKSHVIHIFNKLGVNDRTQAAVWAARNKIV